MLMVNGQPATSALGNFYFSPVRLRPVFEPSYFEKPRLKRTDSNLDLSIDVKPKFRRKSYKSKLYSRNNNEDDEDEYDTDEDITTKSSKKKKNRRKDKKHKKEESKADEMLQHLCSKLRVSFVLGALGVIIFLACCCALFLRNRIVACCRRCWPFRKRKKSSSKTNLVDVEEGEYPYQTSRKLLFKNKSKKSNNPPRMINTGTQDSQTMMAINQEEPSTPVGCSPCSKKKKKKASKKRRK